MAAVTICSDFGAQKKKGYEQIDSENIQIFADTTTIQNLMMIPLSELPAQWDQAILLDTPPQNL